MHKHKFMFIVIVFFMASISGLAQNFNGGIVAGFTASQVDGDRFAGYHRAGLIAGGFIEHDLNLNWNAHAELRFIQKGSSRIFNQAAGLETYYRLRLNYIEIPLIAQYKYSDKIRIDSGFSVGVLFSSREEDENGQLSGDASPPFNTFDFNLTAGTTYWFNPNAFGSLRFAYSVLPVRSKGGETLYLLDRMQFNNLLTFIIGYNFD